MEKAQKKKIEVNNLSFSYNKGKRILNNLNLSIDDGEVIAIIGSNGSGKTTILKILGGLLIPDSGTVDFCFDHDSSRPRLSGVIENPHFWNDLSGIDNIKYYLSEYYDEEKTNLSIDEWGLSESINKPVKSYSLGMRQKLALIIAFLSESEIILFDEPTVALDAESIKVFYKKVGNAAANDRTIIMATHIMYNLEENSNRIYSLKNGQLYNVTNVNSNVNYFTISFKNSDLASLAASNLHIDEICSLNDNELVVTDVIESISEIIRKTDTYDIVSVAKRGYKK